MRTMFGLESSVELISVNQRPRTNKDDLGRHRRRSQSERVMQMSIKRSLCTQSLISGTNII
ncbi:hypothetical protein EYF80_009841 [Liparis tanakae]|uniref:Uncharacterized protein n=1 Tax=Liparis tanakae TaxID=230148 RepID=A0A4Z2IQK3_9TELE|nr:hypothetical protein EYF80_009841 [Liparis tanakae]